MSQWGNAGYGQGYGQQQGQYSTDAQQVNQHLKHVFDAYTCFFGTSAAAGCTYIGSIRIRKQLRRYSTSEYSQYFCVMSHSMTDVFPLRRLLVPKLRLLHCCRLGARMGMDIRVHPLSLLSSLKCMTQATQAMRLLISKGTVLAKQTTLPHRYCISLQA